MELTSPDFEHNGLIPPYFTCDGEDVNPELRISGVPARAKSLALIVDDPDAPGGSWTHWTLWNIEPAVDTIPKASAPLHSTEGMTDFGRTGYGGPCPPEGIHRYFFKIYALDSMLDLTSSARLGDLLSAMDGHIIDQAELVGLYSHTDLP